MPKKKAEPTTSQLAPYLQLPLRFRLFETARHPKRAELRALLTALGERGLILLDDPIVARSRKLSDGRTLQYTVALFRYSSRPAFVSSQAPAPLLEQLLEQRFGFLVVVSDGRFLATSNAGMSWSDAFLDDVLTPMTHRRVKQIAGYLAAAYEKLSLQHLSISSNVVRNQTLEAEDLSGVMQTLGAGHQAPRVARLRRRWRTVDCDPQHGAHQRRRAAPITKRSSPLPRQRVSGCSHRPDHAGA